MELSNDLISQFAKLANTNPKNEPKTESTAYGTAKIQNGSTYVKIDGSDILTPANTAADVKDGERVIVSVKDHQVTITGNTSSPAARVETVNVNSAKIDSFDVIISHSITADELTAITAVITSLKAINLDADTISADVLNAINANIETLTSVYINAQHVNANDIKAANAAIDNLKALYIEANGISAENITAANAEIDNLQAYNAEFTYVSAEVLNAVKATIQNLDVNKLSVESAEAKYVNIDRTNIDKAWIKQFYAQSGILNDITVDDASFVGELVAVLIDGDLIKAGTIYADKLLLNGGNGLYYQLNLNALSEYIQAVYYEVTRAILTDENGEETGYTYAKTDTIIDSDLSNGMPIDNTKTDSGDLVYSIEVDGETIYYCITYVYTNDEGVTAGIPEEGIHGKAIIAQTITAEQIKVSDLTAFNANIAGFEMEPGTTDSPSSIHTVGKDTVDNTTDGIYLDQEGQFSFGGQSDYIKGYKQVDEEGNVTYVIRVSASSIVFGDGRQAVDEIENLIDQFEIKTVDGKTVAVITDDSSDDTTMLSHDEIKVSDGDDSVSITKNSIAVNEYKWSRRSNGNYGLMWKGETG